MKKSKLILLLLIFSVTFISFRQISDKPGNISDGNNSGQYTQGVTAGQLNANNIAAWFRTNGSFNRDPVTFNAGFEWPKGSGKYARYASGIWLGCVSGNDTLTAIAEYSYDYQPGYVDGNGNPQGNTDSAYRIYLITSGNTTDPDYLNWPVYQGAYTTPAGNPYFFGTQTMFYSYTDAYPHTNPASSTQSLKAQILQTNWCYINTELENVEFIEYKIINRSGAAWNNTYIAMWTDDDLGTATDDVIGCDTSRGLGYTYNFTDNDGIYGAAPPAVGSKLLRSPVIATGNNSDTVKYYDPPGSDNLRIKIGYKYTGMNVFNTYNNGVPPPSDPTNNTETYRFLSGLWRTGESWINPVNSQPTKFAYSGDPVSGNGWIMTTPGDKRYAHCFGPFTMNANDTQSVIIAQVIARGTSNLNSITELRNLSDYVQGVYDNNYAGLVSVKNISSRIPDKFTLSQNYPNPFNPTTKLGFGISELGFVTLKIYDGLGRELQTLVNEKLAPGSYEAVFDGTGLSSGIYFYSLSVNGFVDTKRMILLK